MNKSDVEVEWTRIKDKFNRIQLFSKDVGWLPYVHPLSLFKFRSNMLYQIPRVPSRSSQNQDEEEEECRHRTRPLSPTPLTNNGFRTMAPCTSPQPSTSLKPLPHRLPLERAPLSGVFNAHGPNVKAISPHCLRSSLV